MHDLDLQDFTEHGADRQGATGLGARVRCEVDSDKLDEVLRRLADAGVLSLVSQPPTLEELFLRHYAAGGQQEIRGVSELEGRGVAWTEERGSLRPSDEAGKAAPSEGGVERRAGNTAERAGARGARVARWVRRAGRESPLTGSGALVKLAARRDRVMLPAWIYVITILVVSTGYSFKGLYKTLASREALAAGISHDPTTLALAGPLWGTSVGSLTAYKVGASAAVAAGLMSIFIVIRHTRADEEAGRLELDRLDGGGPQRRAGRRGAARPPWPTAWWCC